MQIRSERKKAIGERCAPIGYVSPELRPASTWEVVFSYNKYGVRRRLLVARVARCSMLGFAQSAIDLRQDWLAGLDVEI